MLQINRDTAARLGVDVNTISNRRSTTHSASPFMPSSTARLNTYHVILEVAPQYQNDVSALSRHLCARRRRPSIPISQFTKLEPRPATLSVNHQGHFPPVTLSFNLAPGIRSARR